MEDSHIQEVTVKKAGEDDILEILSVVWRKRKWIAIVVLSVSVVAAIVSFLLPQSYKSTTTLMPETERSKLASLGGISDLASLAGLNIAGDASNVRLYPTIIWSESVLRNVIYNEYRTEKFSKPVNLIEYWDITAKTKPLEYEGALKRLDDLLSVEMDKQTNVITLSIETEEPQLSADILNTIVSQLDSFIVTKKRTSAGERRKFIEGRLVEVESDLKKSENNLKDFRENNRSVGNSPRLLLEQERLTREIQINSTLYIELKKQYEISRIEEIKDIPIINVLDAARPAAGRSSPKRKAIVLTYFFLSILAAVGYVTIDHLRGEFIRKKITDFRNRIA